MTENDVFWTLVVLFGAIPVVFVLGCVISCIEQNDVREFKEKCDREIDAVEGWSMFQGLNIHSQKETLELWIYWNLYYNRLIFGTEGELRIVSVTLYSQGDSRYEGLVTWSYNDRQETSEVLLKGDSAGFMVSVEPPEGLLRQISPENTTYTSVGIWF